MSQQPFPQQGYAPQQQQFPQQGYAPVQQPGGYGQPAQQGFPAQQQQAPWGGQQAGQQAPQQQAPRAVVETGDSFDDFFGGSGEKIPGFDFGATQNGGEKVIGSQIMGEITEMARMQQRDFATGNPLFFDNGDPRMQIAITLQTELRGWQGVKPKLIPVDVATGQPSTPDKDTGLRRVYVKGDMVRAINQACAQAGGQKPRVGGKLAVRIRGFEPTNKGNDKTLYDAQYLPAPEKVATDSFFDTSGGQPVQQQFQQAPPQQQFQQAPPQQQSFPQAAQQGFTAPVVSTATGEPVVHQQAVPAQQAPQQDMAALALQQQQAAQQGAPAQQFPSTLGNGQAPQGAPEWAQPQGQGYEPQASPAGYDKPPF